MGCGGAKEKMMAMKRKNDNKTKYKDPGQVKCFEYEELSKLDTADFPTLIKAIEESDDVSVIIDKGGLKAASEEPNSKTKDFLSALVIPEPKKARKLAACLYCVCDPGLKCDEIAKLCGCTSGDLVKASELRLAICQAMNIAVSIVPKQCGQEKLFDGAELDKRVPNWYRAQLYVDVRKDIIQAWIEAKFHPEEARDQSIRAPIGEFRERKKGEVDREVKSINPLQLMSMIPKDDKTYDDEANKKCMDLEKVFGVANVEYAKLLEAAEYYKPTPEGGYNEDAMKLVWEKAGASDIYASNTNYIKEMMKFSIELAQGNFCAIQLFALLYCKGGPFDKFESFCTLCNDRDNLLDFVEGKQVAIALGFGVMLALFAVCQLAEPKITAFEKIDLVTAVKVWFNGKNENIPETIKRDAFEQWFVKDIKFKPTEARKAALDFLKANPTFVAPAATA